MKERGINTMAIDLTPHDKFILAKTFTELAIQNNLICKSADAGETAEQVNLFFNTIRNNIDNSDN